MKVLMATMQLDIGGAETHIVELSKELARKGIEVFVASNGGAYTKELEEAGITHFNVPLNRKTPATLYSSYVSLKKIICDNNIDIVHAHARIPAFLCGLLHKKLGFRFVTTAHWVFSTRFPFNLLTNWGERSLAVSDDIKAYLIDNYGCKAENILTTINGVDTNKFSDNIDFSDIAKEFDFGKDKTRIVYVSRMDIDRSLAAHKLIEAVPALFAEIPSLEVVVVGGGNDFEPIKKEAEAVNLALGSRVVIVTNSRTDINKFVAAADVFVGVSRAALEAMACKKPAIIAGNEGYIGIFDEDKLKVSIDTNFCCRGCEQTTSEKLCADLLAVLDPTQSELRKHLGEYSLDIIKKHYSVETMAEDAIKMYVSAAKKIPVNDAEVSDLSKINNYLICSGRRSNDVVLSGYYGFRNSGDDSILKMIICGLREKCPDISITVLSKNPAETASLYNVNSVDRLNFGKLICLLRNTKLLISGGGSLIQDVTSSKSLYYYLSIICLAKLCGAKVMLYANGIGPVNNHRNFKFIEKALQRVDYITLREQSSMDELYTICQPSCPCEVTADPVFASNCENDTATTDALLASGLLENEKFFLVTIRDWKQLDPGFEDKICKFCEVVQETYGLTPFIVPMQSIFDKAISQRLASKISVRCAISHDGFSPQTLIEITGRADFVLGMRLHALIYAVKGGIPAIALDYDPKVSAVMKSIGLKYSEPVSNINLENLLDFAREIILNHDEISKSLKAKSEEFAVLAEKNTKIAMSLINDCRYK